MCSMMAAALYLLFMSATTVSTKAPTDPRIVVYDASLFAPCHPFMMLKQEQPAVKTTAAASSSNPPPPPPVDLTGGSSSSNGNSSGSNSSSGSSPGNFIDSSSNSSSPTPPSPRQRRSLLQSLGSPTLTAAEVAYINAAAAATAASNASSGGNGVYMGVDTSFGGGAMDGCLLCRAVLVCGVGRLAYLKLSWYYDVTEGVPPLLLKVFPLSCPVHITAGRHD